MLKVTQILTGSIKYPNSILSNSKTHILEPVVLKHKPASESPGGLVKTQIAGPLPPEFFIQLVLGEAQELVLLTSVQLLLSLIVLGPHDENRRSKL